MKRDLLKLFALIVLFSLPFLLWSQGYGVKLDESFEKGIPSEWTQETVKGSINWVVNSGDLTYPKGAFEGNSRVEFKGNSNVTTKACARLITPAMDIQGIYQPILVFAHAQSTWTDDFDTLRVLYRASADKEWTELAVFDNPIKNWRIDTLRLIGASRTYQIAFEASDNLGRGVVIDNVLVRSTPRCTEPYALNISKISNDSVVIGWMVDGDAKSVSLKVSKTPLTAEQLESDTFKADVLDMIVTGYTYSYNLKGLTAGTKYYYYLRSNCGGDISGWSSDEFTTSNVIYPGYTLNFNSRSSGVTYPLNCYVGSSENVTPPYINVKVDSDNKGKLSPDNSYVVCFNGAVDSVGATALPASSYSYFALPQVKVDENKSISDLYVSFYAINYAPYNSDRSSIMVGVMTDPNDYYSFEVVDTVNITSMRVHEHCYVSLEKYRGEGKYIAFMSQFSVSNIFIMDNLLVDYRPEVLKVNNFKMRLTSATQVEFDFPFSYDKYEIVLAEKAMSVTDLDAATPQVIANGGVLTVKPATQYFVYARGVKGSSKGEWSDRRILRTVGKIESLPTDIVVDIDRNDISTYYPVCYDNSLVQSGGIMLHTLLSTGNGDSLFTAVEGGVTVRPWVFEANLGVNDINSWSALVLPELAIDLKTTRMTFELMSPTGNGAIMVGCMTDARDITTFQPLTTITAEKSFKYNFVDFADYDIKGKFIAILASTEIANGRNNVRLDKIKFMVMPTCGNVTNIVATEQGDPTKMLLSWDKTDADSWEVRLSDVAFSYENIETHPKWDYNGEVATNSVVFENLKGPGRRYYYTVRAICNGVQGEWSHPESFRTGCVAVQTVPYIEDFDNVDYMVAIGEGEFAVPCMFTQLVPHIGATTTDLYPRLTGTQKVSGYNSISLRKSLSMENKNVYFALPKMNVPIKQLQLSFDVYFMSKTQSISIGVMTDPNDSTTIEELAVVEPTIIGEFVNYIFTFEAYNGEGEHIVVTVNDKCLAEEVGWIYIDDVVVDYMSPCPRPEDVKVGNIAKDRVKLSWRTPATVSQWRVLFAKKRLSAEDLVDIQEGSSLVYKIETVTSRSVEITGLSPNKEYYVYVQPVCGETVGSWSNMVKFRTPCDVLTVDELGVEDFESYGLSRNGSDGYHPECYIVGTKYKGEVEEGYDIMNYIPHCYGDTAESLKHSHSGDVALKIFSFPPYNGAYAITNQINIDDISNIYLKFWGTCGSDFATNSYAKSLIVGVVTDPSELTTFVAIDTLHFTQDYRPYTIYFDKYDGDNNGDRGKYVMFLSEFDIKNGVFIDDVEFDSVPPCMAKLEVDSVGSESIVVKLTGGESTYQVKYSTSLVTEDVLNGSTLDSVMSDNGTMVISGLSKLTTYYVYARTLCVDSTGSIWSRWNDVTIVETNCAEILSLPFYEDWETQPGKKGQPVCWNALYTDGGTNFPALSVSGDSKRVGLNMSGAGATSYLVTPEIDVESLSRCEVSLWAIPNSARKFRAVIVGAVSDVNDIVGTFEPVDTFFIEQPGAYSTDPDYYKWEQGHISFENYTGTAKHIAFTTSLDLVKKYQTKNGEYILKDDAPSSGGVAVLYLDNIEISLIPTCFPGTDFRMVSHTDKSLEIDFNHEEALRYEVKYGPVGFDVETDGTLIVTDSVTKFVINGLTAATEYDVYVRTVCEESDKSAWGYAGVYKTAPELITTMPYSINFDNEAENAKWLFSQEGQANQWFIGVDNEQVVSDKGGKALYISNNGGDNAHYNADVASYSWASRAISLEAGVYTISFDWTCFGEEANDYMRVGMLPTTSTFAGGSGAVKNLDGTSGILGNLLSESRIQDWIELSEKVGNAYRLNGVDTTLAMPGQWNKVVKTIVVTPEMAGLYNMVFYWVNNNTIGEYASKRSAVVDNIVIDQASCTCPYDFKLISVNSTEAKVAIISVNTTESYEVVAFADTLDVTSITEAKLAFHKQVDNDTVTITGLREGVNYKIYVRTVCSTTDNSIWAGPFEVTTSCAPIELNTVLNMDDEDEHYALGLTENVLPNCFVGGNVLAGPIPSLVKNTGNVEYSRSGEFALRLNSSAKGGRAGGYVVLPLVNSDMDITQLNFWMRCIDNDSTGAVNTVGLGETYARRITVGTMTNPYDPTTFVAIGTFEYPYTSKDMGANVSNDVTGNKYWVEVSVPLMDAVGDFVAFRNEDYGVGSNLVYIDDIEFTQISCFTPNSLRVNSISSNSAVFDCNHSDALKYIIQRADNAEFDNARIDEVASLPFKIENLLPMTQYYVKVQTICEEDTSNWSPYIAFTTNRTTPYAESFDRIVNNMNGWQTSNSCRASECFTGSSEIVYSSNLSADAWTTKMAVAGSTINTMHLSAKVENTSEFNHPVVGTTSWLFSPVIDFTNANANYHLLFDLALTDMNSSVAPSETDKADTDDRFMVIISEDAGATWKQENAIIWGTNANDYEYYSIPNVGKRYELDLTKYAGKQIRIAFYVEANSPGATTEIHLDNVHVNVCAQDVVDASVCQTEGFENKYFSFDSEDLVVGEKEVSYWELHTESNQADTLRGVRLHVLPMIETALEAQICEGDVYALNNFPSLMEAGRYKQKVRSANGCDSVVILNLSLIPAQRVTTIDTICSGASLIINGKEYSSSGVYSDTLVSSLGCDSIVTFILKVNDPIQVPDTVNICYGASYDFGTQTITASGDYKEIFTTADGCDSIVLLHATVLPDYRLTLTEVIKSGERYNDNGFVGLSKSGIYTLALKSEDGCDSTIVLNLTVLDGDTTYVEFTITTDDLPYDYETIHYDETTKPGVYVDTVVVTDDKGNTFVVVHKLTIEEGTALEEVNNIDLIMVPNPVYANNTLYVYADFTIEERTGLVVEVFDLLGQCIYVDTPSIYPISIDGLNNSGVYMVRVVTGDGKTYQGKVIVK